MEQESTTPSQALTTAVNRIGSQSALARLCGVSQAAVWKWLDTGAPLPAEHVLTVEAATGVSRHQLRPDIYPLGLQDGHPFKPDVLNLGELDIEDADDPRCKMQSDAPARPEAA